MERVGKTHVPEKNSDRPTIDVSVLIVSWNTRDILGQCVTSLLAHSPFGDGLVSSARGCLADIWVIDNASGDGSAEMVAETFPQVKLIRNQENFGFARANNSGISRSEGRYVLLLNSDTLVPEEFLPGLLRFMDEHPTAGCCSPRLLQVDGTPQPYAFGNDPTLIYLIRRGLNALLFRRSMHEWSSDEIREVDWVSGACMMLRREALDQIGLLDEHFFMYFEDNDLCLRLRRNGWRVFYNPKMAITHLGGQSLRMNHEAQKAYQSSLRYFYEKHYSTPAALLLRWGLWVYNRLRKAIR